ncbi:MAG TPA: hypothetical protein VK995_04730 [Oceanipulchritudo sp.]|nr:hypothetical protein [Oceanipulchritudo sp.]
MNRERISEILETYRPGEGLESDPEVRQALELAAADPELAELRRQIEAFDRSLAQRLQSIQAPSDLPERILAAAKARNSTLADRSPSRPAAVLMSWFHPAAFAAAAAIIILLALSFTFWKRPQPAAHTEMVMAGTDLMQTAHALYASLSPSFKSRDGSEILDYLKTKGGTIPARLPGNIAWDKSFACDVVEVNGTKVSIICFKAPDDSRSMHLFTFHRADFPEFDCPTSPNNVCHEGGCCCTSWGDEEQIHVLFSDKGEENLRAVLDI